MEEATNYRIEVLGELDAKWSDRLGGMSVNIDRKEGQKSVTTLVGPLRDQAALAGIMSTLHELHLSVLSVECLDDSRSS